METTNAAEHLECQVCVWHNGTIRDDPRTRTYQYGRIEVVVGVGKAGRVVAYTKRHDPVELPEAFEFRDALLQWLHEHTPFRTDVLPLLTFGALQHASAMHQLEYRMYPPLTAMSSYGAYGGGVQNVNRLYASPGERECPHPHFFTNVFELQSQYEWPVRVADDYVDVAQRYVGYFYGKQVISGQMMPIVEDKDTKYMVDSSVKKLESDWVEPFVMEDDCPMCQRMTDESVEERVAGFQWEIDKEAGGRSASIGGPKSGDYADSAGGRAQYHDALDLFLAEHPEIWRPFPLIRLPHEVKRKLCIEWNHVVRDWLDDDPRYCYRDGHYYVVWVERIGGLDQRPTRSDTYGSGEAMSYYSAMAAAAASFGGYYNPANPANRPITPPNSMGD